MFESSKTVLKGLLFIFKMGELSYLDSSRIRLEKLAARDG